MAVVPDSSDVFAQQKLADEKCTRTYIFHHNIVSKSKETVQKLKFLDSPSFLFGTTGIRAGSHTPCETLSAVGDVSKVGYFFDIPASLKLSLYTVMT